tara:strand:+ start:305 stop:553 length:249 start_codon:yes stop_codon:yes gene_type:complete
MKSNLKRMSQIQEGLVKHIDSQLKDPDDPLYMATMLLKHSIVLYKKMMTDEEIQNMLGHVIDTLDEEYPGFEITTTTKKTLH